MPDVITDEIVTVPDTPPEAPVDDKAEADAMRAEIAAQGTEVEVEDTPPAEPEAEPTSEPETIPAISDEETEDAPTRKRKSGAARQKAKLQASIAENERLRRELAAAKKEEEPAPKLEDFDGDYEAHERAMTAHEVGKVVEDKLSSRDKADTERRETEAVALAEDDFMERIDEARVRLPDYDATLQALQGHVGQLNPEFVSLIQESDKGEDILYHLGKNLTKAARMNGMGVIAVAKEIGNLEATLSVQKPKTGTKAPPPVAPVRGSGTPPPSNLAKLASSDNMADYVRARQAKS